MTDHAFNRAMLFEAGFMRCINDRALYAELLRVEHGHGECRADVTPLQPHHEQSRYTGHSLKRSRS